MQQPHDTDDNTNVPPGSADAAADDAAAVTPTTDTPTPDPADLLPTLMRCAAALDAASNATDTPLSRMRLLRRAGMLVVVFAQTASQQSISAVGDDFIGAATWLAGYYDNAAAGLRGQASSMLIVLPGNDAASSPAAQGITRVVDALIETATMWREIATAAAVPAIPRIVVGEPDPMATDDATGAAHSTPAVAGIMRIWTTVSSTLASTVTSGQIGNRQELTALTQVMVQTCREAAVMAAMLGG